MCVNIYCPCDKVPVLYYYPGVGVGYIFVKVKVVNMTSPPPEQQNIIIVTPPVLLFDNF